MTLALQTLRTAVIGLVVLGVLLFLPAGGFAYWPGWVFIVVFTVMTNFIGLYLAIKDPETLARRVKAGPIAETRPAQRLIIGLAVLGMVAVLAFSAFDWRAGWSNVPAAVVILGDVLVALGLYVTFEVLRQNRFAASTIETMAGQKVISTGLYGVVRHPMYFGIVIMTAGVPLALGSYWGLLVLVVLLPILMWRITDEEKMLVQELDGYSAYRQDVRFRLAPGLW